MYSLAPRMAGNRVWGWNDGGLGGWMERLTLGFRRFFFFVIPDYEDRSRLARGTV